MSTAIGIAQVPGRNLREVDTETWPVLAATRVPEVELGDEVRELADRISRRIEAGELGDGDREVIRELARTAAGDEQYEEGWVDGAAKVAKALSVRDTPGTNPAAVEAGKLMFDIGWRRGQKALVDTQDELAETTGRCPACAPNPNPEDHTASYIGGYADGLAGRSPQGNSESYDAGYDEGQDRRIEVLGHPEDQLREAFFRFYDFYNAGGGEQS